MRSSGLAPLLAIALMAGAASQVSAGASSSTTAPDAIAEHVAQVQSSGHYKVRLSAAVQLAKSSDPRATTAMVELLEGESSKTLRRLAALSLGTMITPDTPPKLRARVERALTQAAETDEDRKVRSHARRSLEQVAAVVARPSTAPSSQGGRALALGARKLGAGGVFLHVSVTADASRRSPKGLSPVLQDAVRATLRKHLPKYRLDWPSQSPPTASELTQARMRAYRVQAAVTAYDIQQRGTLAEIECTVALQVNAWQGSDTAERWSEQQAASATGRGRVSGANRRDAIAAAQRDCVTAVAERITSEQVVPFLRRLESSKK
jgi:hypothetical protein